MTLTTRTNFNEAAGPHISFFFGRLNPPHFGHRGLIQTTIAAAKNGAWAGFVSKSHDAKKNPLTYDNKLQWIKTLYPETVGHMVEDPNIKTFLQAAAYLYEKGFRSATFIAGEDDIARGGRRIAPPCMTVNYPGDGCREVTPRYRTGHMLTRR